MLKAPFSSEFDPSEEAEGSIDPLGLAPTYERLADRLLPAVTVRMGRPRFVTAMALGACVCAPWDTEAVSTDGLSPPWQVYEWFVVEAFVRAADVFAVAPGIPGIQKVGRAIRNGRPVCASSYLKTPMVFGFSGVFRRLARQIGILTEDGQLDDGGYELLAAWAKDQGLDGIVDASTGAGATFRDGLRRAVAQGLEKGHTTPQPTAFWREIAMRLDPSRLGRKEAKVLLTQILSRAGPVEMVASLKEALVAQRGVDDRDAEAPFLRKLSRHSPAEMRELLTAIDTYEAFGRAITEAFDSLRRSASINGAAPVDAKEFAASSATKSALRALGPSIARVRAHPTLLDWEQDRGNLKVALDGFEAVHDAAALFDAILGHHERVQKAKPPNGKRAWFERARSDKVVVRAGYSLDNPPEGQGRYVHEYRIPTFSGFLADLGAYR